jgi:hypothetical protein
MKVVFCYALPTVVQGFGANETLHFRTTTFMVNPEVVCYPPMAKTTDMHANSLPPFWYG